MDDVFSKKKKKKKKNTKLRDNISELYKCAMVLKSKSIWMVIRKRMQEVIPNAYFSILFELE